MHGKYKNEGRKVASVVGCFLLAIIISVLVVRQASAQQPKPQWVPEGVKDVITGSFDHTPDAPLETPEHENAMQTISQVQLLLEQGKYKESLPILLKSDKIWPGLDLIFNGYLARVFFELGQYDEAVARFSKIFRLDPTGDGKMRRLHTGYSIDAFRYAVALARTGDTDGAIELYNLGLKLQLPGEQRPIINPVVFDDSPYAVRYTAKRMEASARLQIAREALPDFDLARVGETELRKVLALEPSNPMAHLYMGLVHARWTPVTRPATKEEQLKAKADAAAEFQRAESLGRTPVKEAVSAARKWAI